MKSPGFRSMVVCSLVAAVSAPRSALAQDSCNAPAKDAITHLDMPGMPFEPVVSSDGCWLFATLAGGGERGDGKIAVVHRDAGTLSVVRTVSIKGGPTGAVLTHDGKILIVADGEYVAFLDASRLISGQGDPVLGYIGNGSQVGYIYANVTNDDKIAFVAAERAASVIVVDMDRVRAGRIGVESVVARLDVGNAPIAVTLSPDGRYLYTTSEAGMPAWNWPEVCRPEGGAGRAGNRPALPNHGQGAIIVFDAARAVTDPAHAALSHVAAGCGTVRLVLSPDGNTAYVSARADNSLMAFDAQRLVSDTAHALLGTAEVGVAPVGIAVIDNGARVVVTNSNRFAGNGGDHQPLAIIDAAKLRAGDKHAKVGEISAGGFPRELRASSDGRTLFLTNFTSKTVEMIDIARALPPAPAQSDPAWTEPFPPFKIAGNLYYVGSKGLANYLITTPSGNILINSDLEANAPLIRASVEKLGFKFTDIKILLISHAHWDHDAGSALIKKLTGAKYMVMDADVPVVESGGKADFRYGDSVPVRYAPAKVDRVLHDGDEVTLGGTTLVAHLTAGHTKGCTTWTMKVQDGGATYNVVIVCGPGVNSGYKLVGNVKYPQIAEDYERQFRVLKSLPVDYFLGAHGAYYDLDAKYARLKIGGPSPFIDPAGYTAFIAERQNAFEEELARQKAGGAP